MMLGPHTPAAAAVEWPTNLPVRTSAALVLFWAVFDWRRCWLRRGGRLSTEECMDASMTLRNR